MPTLALSVIHLAATAAGLWLLWRLSRSAASDLVLTGATAILSGAMALFLLAVSEPGDIFKDFTNAYLAAGHAVLDGPAALAPEIARGAHGFVNLPIVAYLFAPFALPPGKVASVIFFLIGGITVLAAWLLACRYFRFSRTETALSLFALSAYGPMIYSFREGNTSHMLLLALIGGLALSRARRDIAAGIVFAAAAIIKPPLLLIGIYYALRGRWQVVAGGLGLCVAALALSLLVFGWDMHVLWITNFREYAGAPMPGFNTQSLAAAASRFLLGPGSYTDWDPHALPGLARAIVLAVTLVLLALGVRAALKAGDAAGREDLDLALLLAFICIASTVSWSHYYTWLLPGFAFVYTRLRDEQVRGLPVLAAIAAFVLTMPPETRGPAEAGDMPALLAGFVSSHLLWGGLIFYGVLVWLGAGPLARRRSMTSSPSAAK